MPNRSPPGNGSSTKSPSAFQGNTPPQLRPFSYPMHPPLNMYHNFAFMSYFTNTYPQPMQHPNVNPTGPTCMPSGSSEMQDSATESEKSLHSRDNESEHTSPSKRRKQQASGKRPISRNKMWLPVHDDLLIPFLADHARKGNKPDKQFKISTLHQAASLINDAFNTTFTHDSVKNHVKALRNRFLLMEAAIAISSASWEKETNTVTMDPDTYKAWAAEKANVKLLPYVNTPLKHLDDLRVIVGDDVATGSFRKSVWEDPNSQHSQTPINIPTDDDTPVDVTQVESQTAPQVVREAPQVVREAPQVGLQKSSGVTGGSTSRVPRKRSKQRAKVNDNDSDIARSLEHVAIAIAESSWTGKLESKMREFASTYPSKMLDMAVRSLCANEKEAMVFGILSREGRGDWLKQFAKDHGFGSSDTGANGVGENPVGDAL